MIDAHAATSAAAGKIVPDLLPPTMPRPAPLRRIPFFKAFFLFWIRPRTLGPQLCVASWRRALFAHLLALAVAAPIFSAEFLTSLSPSRLTLHGFREQLAEYITDIAIASTNNSGGAAVALMTVAVLPIFELALLLLATLIMGWCAAGDRASSVWHRSAKNVYWTTTILVPFAACVAFGKWFGESLWSRQVTDFWKFDAVLIVNLSVLFVFIVMTIRCLLVGAGGLVGKADGPAFNPRMPLCDECGYALCGLPIEGRCPECGLSIRESMPGGRRNPARRQTDPRSRGLTGLLRMQWQALTCSAALFREIPVHRGLKSARRFWWMSYLWIVLLSLWVVLLLDLFSPARNIGYAVMSASFAMVLLIAPIVGQAIIMLVACNWAQRRLGITDYRVPALVCYYGSPLFWPTQALVLLAFAFARGTIGETLLSLSVIQIGGVKVSGSDFVYVAFTVAFVFAMLFWWKRLAAGLRAVRYANE